MNGHDNGISAGDFLDWKQQSHSFQQLVAWTGGSFNLATAQQPERIIGKRATPGWFAMQGIPFLFGRDFVPEEGVPGRDHEVILTYKLWNRLGADRGVLGRALRLNGESYTVVGVLAPGLGDRFDEELTVPLAFRPEQINHDYHWLLAMGRLKPDVTRQQAQADMDAVTGHIAASYPQSSKGWGASIEPLQNDFLPKERIRNLWLLLGAVGFVLLIACVNVANLLLAKGTGRLREIAIRGAVGATRASIFVQFLVESLLLALIGGALGVGLGVGLLRAILSIVPEGILPSEANFQLDIHILLTALAVTTAAGVVFGCAPAWYASRVDPGDSLKEGGRSVRTSSHTLRRGLISGEFALALSLLAGAGLAIHSFWNLTRIDLGVRTDHVLVFGLGQPDNRFHSPEQMNAYNQEMLNVLRSLPGVTSAATVTGRPLRGTSDGMPFSVVGGPSYADPSQRPGTGFQSVSPDYYKTLGIQVIRGRSFNDQDTASSVRVAMVNEEFEKRYLKGMDPLQQRLSIEQIIPGLPKLGPAVEWQIVGVFHDVRYGDFRDPPPEVDVPFAQSLSPNVTISVRTASDPAAMSKAIAAAVHSVDSEVALAELRTLDQVKGESLGEDRYTMVLFACFAFLALLLAAVGIYGLMAFVVSQRISEMGLRMALGASRVNVIGLILKEASLLAVIGLVLGLIGAVFVGSAMRTTLYGVASLDFSVVVAVGLILLGTALFASYWPARRAAMIDPMQALRIE